MKFPLSYYQKIAEKLGGKVLTTLKKYPTAWPDLEFQCENKHTWTTDVANIRSGHWCPKWECHFDSSTYTHDRIGFDAYVNAAKENGGKLLSPKKDLVNSRSLLKWECKNGHVFHQNAGLVRTSGNWCTKCTALNKKNETLEKYREWAISKGGKLITKNVTGYFTDTKLEWECANGHKFSATAAHMKQKMGCSICYKEEIKNTYLQEVNKIAVSKGGKCVSTEYLNNFTHLEFRCKNGHAFFANANNIKSGWWCKFCSGSAKHDIELFQKIAKDKGGKLLSKEYINVDSSLDWQCKNGHKFHLSGYLVKNKNKWCPHCNAGKDVAIVPVGQKFLYDIEDMHKLAKEKGGLCLSKKFEGSNTKLKWQCNEGHEWLATPVKIRFGSWCKICRYEQNAIARRLPLSDIIKIVADNEGKLLSTGKSYFLSFPLIKIKCAQGHVWETDIKYIKSGTWCPDCMYDTMSLKTRLPFSHYQKLVTRKGGKLLADESDYLNSQSKLTIRCKKGHVFEQIGTQLNAGYWCRQCG